MNDLGRREVKVGNFNEAIKHFSLAIESDGQSHALYSNRSEAYVKANNYKQALNDANKSIELKSDWPKT